MPETLSRIKKYDNNIKISQWFLDPLIKSGPDYINNKKRVLDKQDFLDANFLTTSPDALNFIKDKSRYNFIYRTHAINLLNILVIIIKTASMMFSLL